MTDVPPAMERMSALDASFLFAEKARAPLHVGALSILEGAPFFDDRGEFRLDDVRRRVEERLPLIPRFRRRPRFLPVQFARPVWIDDELFDIANHVKVMVLPSPGTREELDLLCGQLQMRPLDRDHPLWELWFIGGLDDGNVAMVEKVHHAMIDGVSGVEVAAALLDLERTVAPRDIEAWLPGAAPNDLELLIEGVREGFALPLEAIRRIGARLISPAEVASLATALPDLAWRLVTGRSEPAGLRRPVSATRTLRSVSVPLDRLKAAARCLDATINDVAISAVSGGVRALQEHRGETSHRGGLHVLVPISLRTGDEHLALGNRVSTMVVNVPIDEPDVLARAVRVHEVLAKVKADHQGAGAELLVDALGVIPTGLLAAGSGAVHSQPAVDIVVTNIPGPDCPLYFMGAELLETVPIVPLGGNLTIGVAVLSYNGQLIFGVHADPIGCPDIGSFIDGLRGDLDALLGTA